MTRIPSWKTKMGSRVDNKKVYYLFNNPTIIAPLNVLTLDLSLVPTAEVPSLNAILVLKFPAWPQIKPFQLLFCTSFGIVPVGF